MGYSLELTFTLFDLWLDCDSSHSGNRSQLMPALCRPCLREQRVQPRIPGRSWELLPNCRAILIPTALCSSLALVGQQGLPPHLANEQIHCKDTTPKIKPKQDPKSEVKSCQLSTRCYTLKPLGSQFPHCSSICLLQSCQSQRCRHCLVVFRCWFPTWPVTAAGKICRRCNTDNRK